MSSPRTIARLRGIDQIICASSGKHAEATLLLTGVRGWFKEGFGTPDWKAAHNSDRRRRAAGA
jgi:hypothetical protein